MKKNKKGSVMTNESNVIASSPAVLNSPTDQQLNVVADTPEGAAKVFVQTDETVEAGPAPTVH